MSKFLELFEPIRRGLIGNQFYMAVRVGAKVPETVVAFVKDDAYNRGGYENTEQQQDILLDVIDSADALEFAQYVIEREALPYEEKAKLKEVEQEQYRKDWMAKQPPTKKQISYLEALGCHIIPASKQEASELIERYKSGNVQR